MYALDNDPTILDANADALVQHILSERCSLDIAWNARAMWVYRAHAPIDANIMALRSYRDRATNRVWLVVWQRDCDGVEGTSLHDVAADWRSVDTFCDRAHANAEGPVSITLVTPDEARAFRPHVFDRFAAMGGY